MFAASWSSIQSKKNDYEYENENINVKKQSLTPNTIQVNWKVNSEFPLCPQKIISDPILEYNLNLRKDSVFCQNNTYQSKVLDSVIIDGGKAIIVMTQSVFETPKPWAIAKITYSNGNFLHENMGSFFKEEGALKQFTLLQGKEWTGRDSIDDYC